MVKRIKTQIEIKKKTVKVVNKIKKGKYTQICIIKSQVGVSWIEEAKIVKKGRSLKSDVGYKAKINVEGSLKEKWNF